MALLQVRVQAHHGGMSRSHFRHVLAEYSGCNDTSLYGGHSICQIIPSQEAHSDIAIQSQCRYMPERRPPLSDVPCRGHAEVSHRGGSCPGPANQEEGNMTSVIFCILRCGVFQRHYQGRI
jgi:hypothetical protein